MSETKTKFDYEIEAFESAFKDKKEWKIAIYGIGRMTATLMSRLKGFHIVGLLDRNPSMVGKEIYGTRVISRQEAEREADAVVINTSETYWSTIYQRIQDWKIPVYFRNGERAAEAYSHENREEPYWRKTYDELKEMIRDYEIVSFDIFDTLVMRKLCVPTDVFYIVEKELQDKTGDSFSFVEARKKAAGILENATIDEIYAEIAKVEGWGRELEEKVKQHEIETERRMIVPRAEMAEFYHAIKETKEIYLISDMYLPGIVLKKLLSECGIEIQEEKILVSCDLKKSKEDGTIWQYYRDNKVEGKKAIHVGDNEWADVEQPKRYGIDTFSVWDANKLLQKSSASLAAVDINTTYASFCIGSFNAKLFNSPFSLQGTNGEVTFANEQDAGYCLLGGVAYVFCRWLLEQVKENKVRQLAFFAREGYLLSKLFCDYCQLTKEKDIPEIIYLETSRRAVMTASIRDRKDMYEIADFPYVGSIAGFLWDRFGISVEEKDLRGKDFGYTDEDKRELWNILERYEKDILLEAGRERENYLVYLESVGLKPGFAIVDSQLYGTTQYYLGKLLGEKLRGYYFCACRDKTNRYLEQNIMEGCFTGKKELDGKDSAIYKNAAFIEAFFTAPNGMLECMESDGTKRYADKKQNQLKFEIRLEMLEGIRMYMEEAVEFCTRYCIDIGEDDIYFTDKMFERLMNKGFKPTAEMKSSFYYDNGIAGNKEMPIWE